MKPTEHTPESDEVSAHQYRLAQANRYSRFVSAGGSEDDLHSICDSRGKIAPEKVDFAAVRNA